MQTTAQFITLNAERANRVPQFSPDTKIAYGYEERGQYNQHTLPSFDDNFDDVYGWLNQSSVQITGLGGFFTCWIGDITLPGIASDTDYLRFSFRGVRVLAHLFTWLYHHPGARPIGDISHLCGNNHCLRPSHLFDEPHSSNIARIGCSGYILIADTLFSVCKHNPHCKKVTALRSVTQVPAKESINPNAA